MFALYLLSCYPISWLASVNASERDLQRERWLLLYGACYSSIYQNKTTSFSHHHVWGQINTYIWSDCSIYPPWKRLSHGWPDFRWGRLADCLEMFSLKVWIKTLLDSCRRNKRDMNLQVIKEDVFFTETSLLQARQLGRPAAQESGATV